MSDGPFLSSRYRFHSLSELGFSPDEIKQVHVDDSVPLYPKMQADVAMIEIIQKVVNSFCCAPGEKVSPGFFFSVRLERKSFMIRSHL